MPETRPCSLPDCERPCQQGWKYCGSHYMKWYRHGDPYYLAPKRYGPDLTGRRVGALVVLGRIDGSARWQCQCDCGNESVLLTGDINRGKVITCGDRTKHAHPRAQLVVSYAGAHDRVKLHNCVECGAQAADWSYNHDDPDELHEWLNWATPIEVAYSLSPEHYAARCKQCHRRFDRDEARGRRWRNALVKYEADIT
jgi:hypothetical protein